MISTAGLIEIREILEARHGNPHNVLGMHELLCPETGRVSMVARVFAPTAERVWLIDAADESYAEELNKIHLDGFFEKLLPGRSQWFRYRLRMEGADGNAWEAYDPYSFMPVLSDLDLHLFGEGTHYRAYEKLGAHPMTVDGIEGVLFAVWAPNARRGSVVGDFNGWDARRCPMRVLAGSGVWELFVPGLKAFDNYKYEIRSLGGGIFLKTDPYASFNELRPGSASLVFGLGGYKWGDGKWQKSLGKRDVFREPMNIYEVHLGSWKRKDDGAGGSRFMSYPELADELVPYVKEMGYTHIELMPISEYPFDGSWGYQVTGYFAPTSRYGTPHEFMAFVDRCHQSGIGVILDWVPAHFPKDAHGLAKFDGTALYEHEDARRGEHPDWGTLIFNFGRKEVKNFLIANALYWLDKFHIDGLRVDAVASMLYLDYGKDSGSWLPNRYGGKENLDALEFIKHMNSIIAKEFPGALIIAEESTSWTGVTRDVKNHGLGFSLKWNMGWMNDFLTYISKDPVHRKYHHNNLTFGMIYAYSERFILVLSHDEVVHGKRSLMNKLEGGDIWQKCANLRAALMFMYGHPGKKLIFMGGEFGQFDEWSEAKALDWFLIDEHEHHAAILRFTKALNHFYRDERALWLDDFYGSGFEWIDCDDNAKSVVSFQRKTGVDGEKLIFVCNFAPTAYEDFRVGVDKPGAYAEVFNSDRTEFGGSGVTNPAPMTAKKREWNKKPYSVGFRLPPLAGVVIKIIEN